MILKTLVPPDNHRRSGNREQSKFMTLKETVALKLPKIWNPPPATLAAAGAVENARSRSRRGLRLLTAAVVAAIAAVAYADSRVDEISLGYLYLLPLALSSLVHRMRTSFSFVLACIFLHDYFGPPHAFWARIFLNLFALVGFSVVVLLVRRLGREREVLSEIVRRQRDELQAEIRLAAEVQSRLLPAAPPVLPNAEIRAGMKYARETGGDYYDFIELENGNIGVAIADVSGKGIAAAMLMPTVETALRCDAAGSQNINETFRNLNRVVYDVTDAARFITLFCAVFDARAKTLEYVNAGHNPPLVLRRETGAAEWLESGGAPIGLFANAVYESSVVRLEAGDVLVCYTDGLSEAENPSGEEFSRTRIAETIRENAGRGAREIYETLRRAVENFRAGADFDDDLTLIVLKILG